MAKWVMYNPSPTGKNVGDCAVRAVAKALGVDWETAYILIAEKGFLLGDMPSSDSVWGEVLKQHGFKRYVVPNKCPSCYTVSDFADDHPTGTFVLGTGQHAVAVIDGIAWDSWDSTNEIPLYFWYRVE